MYKTVISDLDGTLLSNDHKIDSETLKTVRKLIENDVEFIIATGRTYIDAKRIVDAISYPIAVIGGNGTQLYDEKGNKIYSYKLLEKYLDYIYSIDYKKYGEEIILNTFTEDKWYVHEMIEATHYIHEWTGDNWKFEYKEKTKINKTDINKVFFIGKHENLLKLEKEIKEYLFDNVNMAFTLANCLEIFPKNATKANALKELAKIKKIDLSNAVAFGDGFNDVEMLRLVSKGYIMGNAQEKLKKEMNDMEVIGINNEQGVANKLKGIFKWL